MSRDMIIQRRNHEPVAASLCEAREFALMSETLYAAHRAAATKEDLAR